MISFFPPIKFRDMVVTVDIFHACLRELATRNITAVKWLGQVRLVGV